MAISRRTLLSLVGLLGGSGFLSEVLAERGHASPIRYAGPPKLQGDPGKQRVVILGAGLAGLTAAYELRNAGYSVQVLEYAPRIGGRSWTLRGGDVYTELGGHRQVCGFDDGLYMNPGPWRISHTHRAILDYCERFSVPVEPFLQINFNGYVHSKDLFDGKPQRYGQVIPDFNGHVAELLDRAMGQDKLSAPIDAEDRELLEKLLSSWGGLDRDGRYTIGEASARMRGPASIDLTTGKVERDSPTELKALLKLCDATGLWRGANHISMAPFQMPLFQPVGGMDRIAHAFGERLEGLIQLNARVTEIRQNEQGVRVVYEDQANGGDRRVAEADWCICTLPFTILSQIAMDVGAPMKRGIDAIPYNSEVKIGLQFKRRFWERDDGIYGGFTITDLPIREIAYPSHGLNQSGKGVLYGAVVHGGPVAWEMGGMTPQERIDVALKYGAMIHPQYATEYENGMAVSWYRNPYSMGCTAKWTDELVAEHLADVRHIDGRIALAGESISVFGWQDGAIMSAQDTVERLHARIMAG